MSSVPSTPVPASSDNKLVAVSKLDSVVPSAAFDKDIYATFNPDVAKSWKGDLSLHYRKFGSKEGRIASRQQVLDAYAANPDFDLAVYRSSNLDLASMTDDQLFAHFLLYGKQEGRPFSKASLAAAADADSSDSDSDTDTSVNPLIDPSRNYARRVDYQRISKIIDVLTKKLVSSKREFISTTLRDFVISTITIVHGSYKKESDDNKRMLVVRLVPILIDCSAKRAIINDDQFQQLQREATLDNLEAIFVKEYTGIVASMNTGCCC